MVKFTKLALYFLCGLVFMSTPVAATLISSQTVTNQTAVTFTGITSTFDHYLVVANNVTNPTFAGNFFGIQVSTNGGTSYINTGYSSQYAPLTVIGIFNPTATSNGSFQVLLTNLTSGIGNILANGTAVVYDSAFPGCYAFGTGGGYTVSSTVADAIQFVSDDGSAFSGTFTLYGYTP